MIRVHSKYVWAFIASAVGFLLLVPKEYNATFDGEIRGVDAEDVWRFVADFNNMKNLNPTIETFFIMEDNGDYYRWVYTVSYTEHLSNLPFIKNSAIAKYQVYHQAEPRDEYVVESNHRTCFIGRYFCMNSSAKFSCRQKDLPASGSYCWENVTYECPRMVYTFCNSEVMHQRREIFKNLDLALSEK